MFGIGEDEKRGTSEEDGSFFLVFKLLSLNWAELEHMLEIQFLLGVVVFSTPMCVHIQELYTLC